MEGRMEQVLNQGLKQKQELGLRLSQKMTQSLEILQKNSLEITEEIIHEQENNPFLEVVRPDQYVDAFSEMEPDRAVRDRERDLQDRELADAPVEVFDDAAPLNFDDRNAASADDGFSVHEYEELEANTFEGVRMKSSNDADDDINLEQFVREEKTFEQKLEIQIGLTDNPDAIKNIMVSMCYSLDDLGFLPAPDEELAERFREPLESVREARELLKRIDSPALGCGSRNLTEYLKFMILESGTLSLGGSMSGLAERLFGDESLISLLEGKAFARLSSKLGATYEELGEFLTLVQNRVSPFPKKGFSRELTQLVKEDIEVRLGEEGNLEVKYNNRILPMVRIDTEAYSLMKSGNLTAEQKDENRRLYDKAANIVSSLDDREKTIVKVTRSIFLHQIDFMRHGIDFIKPLTLEVIAREIGHDISTVSRATNGKYVKTPFGLFELKFFFAKQVKDNMATNLRVDKKIAEIIENEDKNSPLSDDEIALRLKEEGIEIARRTVAKRRTMLKIPSAHERKNDFRFTSGRSVNV